MYRDHIHDLYGKYSKILGVPCLEGIIQEIPLLWGLRRESRGSCQKALQARLNF